MTHHLITAARAAAEEGQRGCAPLAPRRLVLDLRRPVRLGDAVCSSIRLRAADLPDLLVMPDAEIGGDRAKAVRWLSILADLPPSATSEVCDADLEIAASLIDPGLWSLRQAAGLSARDFLLPLDRPVDLGEGRRLAALPLRPPLFSDYVAMGWRGWLERAHRLGPAMVDVRTDNELVARWASRLSGVDLDIIRRLALPDARRVLDEVSSLVCGFSVFVIASN